MPKIPDVIDGELVESAWGNQSIRDRTVQRMDNVADRDASIPSPGTGETIWVADIKQCQVWDGSHWLVAGTGVFLPLAGGTLTGRLLLPDGADDSPSLSFTGWNNAGFYLSSAAQIGITANGERIALFTNNDTVFASGLSIAQRGTERPSLRIGDGSQSVELYYQGVRRELVDSAGTMVTYKADGATQLARVSGDHLLARGAVISSESCSTQKIGSGVTLMAVTLPSLPANMGVAIEVVGNVGFDGVDRSAGFSISGTSVTKNRGERVFVTAGNWATTFEYAEIAAGDVTGQTVTVKTDADGNSFYRASMKVWINAS